jgi:hypothetical protein
MATTTRACAKSQPRLPAVRGNARWVGLVPNRHTLDAGCGWLRVTTERGEADYWVKAHRDAAGKVVGYTMTRFDLETDVPIRVYDIDCTFGPGPGHWECDCPSHVFQAQRREDGCCKHTKSLHAALARAGL